MKPDVFARPVQILIFLGFPMEIRTAAEAYRHLVECPHLNKDASYTLALNACRAALQGVMEVETARGLYAAFAAKHDLLVPAGDPVIAYPRRRDHEPHIR